MSVKLHTLCLHVAVLAIKGMHEAFYKASHFLRELQTGNKSVATVQ